MDLGILCHLANFENHLKAVCYSTKYLVLETAVCDSDDPNKSIPVQENKGVYDLSINGMGCRPSAAAIERVLQQNGMNFTRVDNARFNSGSIKYDWRSNNDNSTHLDKRRIWFCSKDENYVPIKPQPAQPSAAQQARYDVLASSATKKVASITKSSSPKPPQYAYSKAPEKPQININPSYTSGFSSDVDEIREASRRFGLITVATGLQLESGRALPLPEASAIKVLYLSLGEQTGMVDAWNNVGVNLQTFDFYGYHNYNRSKDKLCAEFLRIVNSFQPNLIHMQLQFTGLIDATTLSKVRQICPGVIITNWSGDIRKEAVFDFISLTHSIDYALISSTGQLDLYRRAGCKNIRYWQIGYNTKANFPMWKQNFDYDASFIGNAYGNQFPDSRMRADTINNLKGKYGAKMGTFGNGYAQSKLIPYSDVNAVYNKTICPISISNFNNVSHYFSDRLLHCVASGRPTLSWYFPGIESYFVEGSEILIIRSTNDAINHIKFCIDNPVEANRIGKAGYDRVVKEHTFTSRVLELLTMTNLIHPDNK